MKNKKAFLGLTAFLLASVAMLVALNGGISAVYAEHSRSMVVGTLAYIAMSGIVLSGSLKNKKAKVTAAITAVMFILTHILIEASLFSTIGVSLLTGTFGYLAIAAFAVAGLAWLAKKVTIHPALTLTFNGSMTAAVSFVYYHVASLDPIRSSALFFVPFTLMLVWTIAQFALQVKDVVATKRQTA